MIRINSSPEKAGDMTALTDAARETIQSVSDNLVEAWGIQKRLDEEEREPEYWDNTKDSILSKTDFTWRASEGARIVCGVSRTIDGWFATDDSTPVIVKFEPWIADQGWKPEKFDNQHEIEIWNEALEQGDDDLFADIVEYEDNGRWLVMEECIPIRRYKQAASYKPADYLYDADGRAIGGFSKKFEERGWYEHDLKHGNIGVHPDSGDFVLLDYGSFTEYQG